MVALRTSTSSHFTHRENLGAIDFVAHRTAWLCEQSFEKQAGHAKTK